MLPNSNVFVLIFRDVVFERTYRKGIMKTKTVAQAAISLFACFIFSFLANAQEGHPMTGSWVGDWGPNAQERHRVVVIMEWTGKEITGTINPGPNAIPIKKATVDPVEWSIHIEANGVDSEGRPAPFVIDGKLDDLGTYNRTLSGTWNVGKVPGTFSITRQ